MVVKRYIIGAVVAVALGTAATAVGWSHGHLAAESAKKTISAAGGQVAGAATTPSPSTTPLLHGSAEQAAANADIIPTVDATPDLTVPVTVAPTVTPSVSPLPTATPSPAASTQPTKPPLPIQPPVCGQCGGPVVKASSSVQSNMKCPMICIY